MLTALTLWLSAMAPFSSHAASHAHAALPADANEAPNFAPQHPAILKWLDAQIQQRLPIPALCFDPDTDPRVVEAFNQHQQQAERFNLFGTRWDFTALQPEPSFNLGTPTMLTWSIVPDGTLVPNLADNFGPSNLRAFLNSIYGSESVWLPIFQQVFDRWEALTGVDYVYVTYDDSSPIPDNDGFANVRADLRIGGRFLDGPSNVLAFNYFPPAGDMVIDTGDTFYNITSNNDASNNFLRLRNVLAHEHGHGAGLRHVCPISATKLMEPFVALPFDGPQHDDIRAAQLLYGDDAEPNNTPDAAVFVNASSGLIAPGTVTVLGPTPAPVVPFASVLSVSTDADEDWFRFSVSEASRLTITLAPVGVLYDNSAQACSGALASCCKSNFTNSLNARNLVLDLASATGTLLDTIDQSGAGQPETAIFDLAPGEYTLRVRSNTLNFDVQSYNLTIDAATTPTPLTIAPAASNPVSIVPGSPANLVFNIDPGAGTIVGTPQLFVREGTLGTFTGVNLATIGSGSFQATVNPEACLDELQFYVEAQSSLGPIVRYPAGAPATVASVILGEPADAVFFTVFTPTDGWTVQDTQLSDGSWERANPFLSYCGIGDPSTDFDLNGSCFVTDDDAFGLPGPGGVPPAAPCDNDVDGTQTTLISPIVNLAGLERPRISYARWFNNGISSSINNDTLIVEVSANGGASWSLLEQVGPASGNPPQTSGGWIQKDFPLEGLTGSTSEFRVRFRVGDTAPSARVEAAIDAVRVYGYVCGVTPVFCPGDADRNGSVAFADITSVLSNFGNAYLPPTVGPGDADGDGGVFFGDVTAVLANFGTPCP